MTVMEQSIAKKIDPAVFSVPQKPVRRREEQIVDDAGPQDQ